MDERDGATSQKVNICMYISIHIALLFLHQSGKKEKKCLIDDVLFQDQDIRIDLISFVFIFFCSIMIDAVCHSRPTTCTRHGLFRYRLPVSNAINLIESIIHFHSNLVDSN